MSNVIIYVEGSSSVGSLLERNEDLDVRCFNISEIKDYNKYNPSLIVIDASEKTVSEVLMTIKFNAPVLLVSDDVIENLTIRAENFDYILKPVNSRELYTRVDCLLKFKELKDSVSRISNTDELTGLYNRKYLQDRLEAEISRAKRYDTKLSCLLIDIDFFKVVNDMYGYDWGDVLLKRIATILKNLIRKEDILTRYGDEEFLLILPNTSEPNAFIFAERFRRDIEKMEFIPAGEEEKHPITISGGISSFPFLENVEENANTLIRYAEHALYNAKKRGKNKIIQFSQINIEY